MLPSRCSVPASSTNPNGSVNSYSVCSIHSSEPRSAHAGVTLVRDLELFDTNFVVRGVRRRTCELIRPGLDEIPARDRFVALVVHHDRAVLSCGFDFSLFDLFP